MSEGNHMKLRIHILAFIFALFLPGALRAQIELVTDRTLYATGEEILFTAYLTPSGETSTPWSKVLYLTLVSPDGTSVSRGKYPISSYTAKGYLNVPDQLLTGNYYLVAYTRWMQNFGPTYYEYKQVKVINPFTSQLEPSCLQGNGDHMSGTGNGDNPADELIDCIPERQKYRRGEEVNISIHLGTIVPSASPFTVVAGRPEVMDSMLNTKLLPESIMHLSNGSLQYFPDLLGLSLSGKVTNSGSGEPVEGALVELSVLERDLSFRAGYSREDGTFLFALDSMTGSKEMFITASHPEYGELEVRVDNDFAPSNFSFPPMPFRLSDEEKIEATRIMQVSQIKKSYQDGVGQETDYRGQGDFYGVPTSRILIDDYIQLPTLSEVITELVPGVIVVTRSRKRSLQFNGNVAKQAYMGSQKPLILVDNVPVRDLIKFLALSPQKVFSIEVIDELYFLGDVTYGGIISLDSRKGDMAGMDLPEGSFFFDFNTYLTQPEQVMLMEAGHAGDNTGSIIDNTLYWDPELDIVPGRTHGISLTAPDRPGRYLVLVRGLSKDGRMLQGRGSFVVVP